MKREKRVLCILIIFVMICAGQSNMITAKAAEQTGTVTATTLNVRKGAGTENGNVICNGKAVFLKKGDKVTITKTVGKWYLISCTFNGQNIRGYVLSEYIKLNKSSEGVINTSSNNVADKMTADLIIPGFVNADNLNVRKAAGTQSEQLIVNKEKVILKKNVSVNILNEITKNNQKWYRVSFNWKGVKKSGYVLSDYIKLKQPKAVAASVTSKTAVKIRTGAGSKKAILTVNKKQVSLKKGNKVMITGETTVEKQKWFKITFTYSNTKKSGYILASKVAFTPNRATDKDNETDVIRQGTATTALRVRSGAGTDNPQVMYSNGDKVTLVQGQTVTVISEKKVGNVIWYSVKFKSNSEEITGYVSGEYLTVKEVEDNQTISTGDEEKDDDDENKSDSEKDNADKENPSDGEFVPGPVISDQEFEANLTAENFPEDYKTYLRELHEQYPYWEFKAYHTGLDWDTVIANESAIGKNLITNSKNVAWKSTAPKAYNWATDKFIVYDGSTWVTASEKAVSYYMDPRNFLNANGVFQFEALDFRREYQNKAGVENILKNTPMYNTSYSYTDVSGETKTYTYGETFMAAAEYSGVSPYHLATRVKQEVVTGTTTLSSSVTGKVEGYEGYYNFYNIGATHSTSSGGAVINALKYAKTGTVSAITNALYMIPWNNQYSSLVGGSQFIGSSYIKRGQNTIYLQKFNVTPTSTYSHQYMANVEAAYSEAKKTFAAYSGMTDVPIVFSIPVYNNMPSSPASIPVTELNPNNWLKSLSVKGYSLTPTFDVSKDQTYNLIVEANVESININAAAVNNKAVITGAGTVVLNKGSNEVIVDVIAENGDLRRYIINVFRE